MNAPEPDETDRAVAAILGVAPAKLAPGARRGSLQAFGWAGLLGAIVLAAGIAWLRSPIHGRPSRPVRATFARVGDASIVRSNIQSAGRSGPAVDAAADATLSAAKARQDDGDGRSAPVDEPLAPLEAPSAAITPPPVVAVRPTAQPSVSIEPPKLASVETWAPEDAVSAGPGRAPAASRASSGLEWLALPSDQAVRDQYPLRAWRQGLGGSVLLACREGLDGRVSHCRVLIEHPDDLGFGRAAIALSKEFRLRPLSAERRAAGDEVRIPYDFSVTD